MSDKRIPFHESRKGERIGDQAAPIPVRNNSVLRDLLIERVERFLETAGVALLGFGQGFEPISDFVEAFLARSPRHARIHVGVFMGLAGDGRGEVLVGRADRLSRGGGANPFWEFRISVAVPGLPPPGWPDNARNIV